MSETYIQPTYGLEIELPWSTMLRRVDTEAAYALLRAGGFYGADELVKTQLQAAFDEVDSRYKHAIDSVFGDDIRRGRDAYVEFALQPKKSTQELVEVVQGLYDKDLLREGEAYPLQYTIGNIAASPAASYILLAAEVCGGTSAERIREINTWSKRGVGGLWNRRSRDMQLGMTKGVELRSLQLMGMHALRGVSQVIQGGAELVAAREKGDDGARYQWQQVVATLKDFMAIKDIDITKPWWNPDGQDSVWPKYADALEDESWRTVFESEIYDQLKLKKTISRPLND